MNTQEDLRADEQDFLNMEGGGTMIDVVKEACEIMFKHRCAHCGGHFSGRECGKCGNVYRACAVCKRPVDTFVHDRLCLKCDAESMGKLK